MLQYHLSEEERTDEWNQPRHSEESEQKPEGFSIWLAGKTMGCNNHYCASFQYPVNVLKK